MRIGIFTNTYYPAVNGVSNCVVTYREGLMARGHEVVVFAPCPSDYDRGSDPDNVYRFPAVPMPMDVDYSIAFPYSRSVVKALRRLDFDIVHTQHPVWVGAWGAWYARWADVPLVTTVHTEYELFANMVPLPEALVEMYLRLRVTSYCNKCQMVTTAVNSTRQRLLTQGVTTPINILPNPTDITIFANGHGTGVRRRYGLDDETVLLGFVGRLSPEKNLGVLLEGIAQVLREEPHTAFLVVGEGPEKENMEQMVTRLAIADRVFFAGAVAHNEIPDFQAALDLFVSTSLSETQPLAYTEAMAAATPVVAMKAPGAEDMIQPGVNGLLFDPQAGANGLAATVLPLVQDRPRRVEMGRQAQQWVEQFDTEHIIEQLLGIYQQTQELAGEAPI